jgi:hypothetical protein
LKPRGAAARRRVTKEWAKEVQKGECEETVAHIRKDSLLSFIREVAFLTNVMLPDLLAAAGGVFGAQHPRSSTHPYARHCIHASSTLEPQFLRQVHGTCCSRNKACGWVERSLHEQCAVYFAPTLEVVQPPDRAYP